MYYILKLQFCYFRSIVLVGNSTNKAFFHVYRSPGRQNSFNVSSFYNAKMVKIANAGKKGTI